MLVNVNNLMMLIIGSKCLSCPIKKSMLCELDIKAAVFNTGRELHEKIHDLKTPVRELEFFSLAKITELTKTLDKPC